MRLNEKINFKIYLFYSIAILTPALIFCHNLVEVGLVLLCYCSVIISQSLMVGQMMHAILKASGQPTEEEQSPIIDTLLRIFLIASSLSLSVHLMGNRVIIPLLVYVSQIFILNFSLNREKQTWSEFFGERKNNIMNFIKYILRTHK